MPGSHKIDAVFYVTGLAPVDVWARSQNQGSNVQINTSVSGRLRGEVLLCMDFIGNASTWAKTCTFTANTRT